MDPQPITSAAWMVAPQLHTAQLDTAIYNFPEEDATTQFDDVTPWE
jgi:hypothetical protein